MSAEIQILDYTKEEINEALGKVLDPQTPTSQTDLATKQYVDETIEAVVSQRYVELHDEPGGQLPLGTIWRDMTNKTINLLTTDGWVTIHTEEG